MIFKFEVTKLLRTPAVWGFLLAALAVNVIFALGSSHKDVIDYFNTLTETTGTVYDDDFDAKLAEIKAPSDDFSQEYYYYSDFAEATEEVRNDFADITGDELQNRIKEASFPMSPAAKKILHWKYEKLKPVVAQKAADQDGADIYFARQTNFIHETVFTNYLKMLGAEACILFVLLMLYALGYERMASTDLVVYATKKGRRLVLLKGVAALCVGTGLFILLYAVSYGFMFLINDFSVVWTENVSAQFHTIFSPGMGAYPFITWSKMSIGAYFFACVFVSFLQCVVFALFAAPFGLLIRNVYGAFCAVLGISFVHFALIFRPSMHVILCYFLLMQPFPQIYFNQYWFSDGGSQMLIPHFELLYPLICILVLVPVIFVCYRRFKRKELF